MLKKFAFFALILMFVIMFTGIAMAAGTANQTVTFAVSAINEISVSGNPAILTVNAASAGSEPNEVTNSSTTYSITTNESTKKITAGIDSDMPANVTLKVNLVAPSVGTSSGDKTLSTTAENVVTGITKVTGNSLTITYKLSALVAAGELSSSRTVTFTITN